ncbi:putative membrane protein [Salibacterium salarium]|uniref:hypothetical protein n=1 Tax=Salibacterium salarium TaxID=284579 RepID=UPI002784DC15|nr:hypothetical protein [Salibacterium salarium]MDQ0298356.1 putative membrane protein [Salibacterium salarium]
MINGKWYKLIVGILAVIGLIALLGNNLFRVFTILMAVLLFYTGAKLLQKQSSSFMIVTGIAMLVLGSLVLTGWLPTFLAIIIIIGTGYSLLKLYKDKDNG